MLRLSKALAALTLIGVGCSTGETLFGGDPLGDGGAGGAGGQGMGGQGNTGAGGSGAAGACGDGTIGAGEECDGAELDGQSCADLGFENPAGLGCDSSCQLDDSGCMASCDGGGVEPGEECDGADLDGATCLSLGYTTAAGLACEDCQLDPSGCMASCDGAGIEPGEDCDGSFLNGNDCTAFGFSSAAGLGCSEDCAFDIKGCTPTCDGALVEPGEACDDGNNDPDDGCDDCQATGILCNAPIPLSLSPGTITHSSTTVGGGQHESSQCDGEQLSPDRVYAVTPSEDGFLTAWLDPAATNFDSVLYALSDCADPMSGRLCADNLPNGKETLSFEVEANTTYFIVVDGWQGASGDYTLSLDLSDGTCADPVPYPLWDGVQMRAIGSIVGKPNNHVSTGCGGAMSGDVVYELQPHFTNAVEARLIASGTPYMATIAARTACGDQLTQLACDFDAVVGNDEFINLAATDGVPIYVWVDGGNGSEGAYVLRFDPP